MNIKKILSENRKRFLFFGSIGVTLAVLTIYMMEKTIEPALRKEFLTFVIFGGICIYCFSILTRKR